MRKMKKIFLLTVFLFSVFANSENQDPVLESHSHEGHKHEILVDGKKLEVDPERFDNFIQGESDVQVAIISVFGMVCDFCARGIERTFKKDKFVQKVDVDLDGGKVLIIYDLDSKINFEDIKRKITSNGQNATDLQILRI